MYLRSLIAARRRAPLGCGPARARQRGVVLFVALIILVALTLAGVALMRSVDTANLVAGNMSFHQAAIQAGERSTEQALAFLVGANTTLHGNSAPDGYIAAGLAAGQNPADHPSPQAFWDAIVASAGGPRTNPQIPPVALPYYPPPVPAANEFDAAGNRVEYIVQRLCENTGAPFQANCAKPPNTANTGGSQKNTPPPISNIQVYYRITTRITGPRNTVAYVQTIVAL